MYQITDAYTHSGYFHTDDVVATAFLLMLNPLIKVHRVKDIDEEVKCCEEKIVYDIGLGKYDHHQDNRQINTYGYPYSAFGLLWEDYGRELLEIKGFKKIEEGFLRFRDEIVSKIDQGDNCGYADVPCFYENVVINNFNSKWYESNNDANFQDKQFNKAVEYASLLLDNWLRKTYSLVEMSETEQRILNDALDNSENGIVILKENIPWRNYVNKDDQRVKIIINKNPRGGYNVISKDTNIIPIMPNEFFSFVHPSNFMGIANSLHDAISGAKKIVEIFCS